MCVGGGVFGFLLMVSGFFFKKLQCWSSQVSVQSLLRIKDSKEFSMCFRMQEGPNTFPFLSHALHWQLELLLRLQEDYLW